ncbi:hypothetical protein GCM10020221_02430 [Streptomyces thioluteus]|uniref:Uncharacterized protein n=1 Tax=Streptomyces thioluteus TaxID=66431 RepID=A0ABP6IUH5_STRTU
MDVLSSLSFYRLLPEATREAVLADVAGAVDAYGGQRPGWTPARGLFLARTGIRAVSGR